MKKETIVVTGGAGYIGSHTCKALHQAGFIPIVYDRLSTGHAKFVQWGPLVIGELVDQVKLNKVFLEYQPKAVLHFAANAIVSESMIHPSIYYENNVQGSLSLLQAMKQANIPYLIFSSTCATYGNAQTLPMSESHPQFPINPYGQSKLMVERMILDFEKAYGMKSGILRYFNAAGADLSKTIGEDHTPETHLIPSIIQIMLDLRESITIYGKNFPSPDGTAIRDYIHVTDLASAHVLALQRLLSHAPSFAVNLGTGKGISILEIIQEVEKFYQKKVPIRWEEKREGDPAVLYADATLARTLLQWTPQYSDIQTIIQSACHWHESMICKT